MLGALAVIVVVFAAFATSRMFPARSYGLADDWRVFYGAAVVVQHGGSPYDPALIHAAEQTADTYPAVQPSLDDFANLPLVAWILQPMTVLPFWTSYALSGLLGLLAAGVALRAWLRRWGWRCTVRWSAFALLSWPALLGVFSGQFDLLLLAALIGAMALALRRHPAAAGALCMSAALVKPHILWPLPLLIAASQYPDRRAAWHCVVAAATTVMACVLGGELLMPGATRAFVGHLFSFASRIGTTQPDLSGLPGMFEHLPGGGVAGVVVTLAGAATTVGFALFWMISRRAQALPSTTRVALGVGLGMAIWLVATPYAHPNDDVLLFPLLALVLGADAGTMRQRDVGWALVVCLGLIAAFLLWAPSGIAFGLAAAAVMLHGGGDHAYSQLAACSLVGMAILPMVWPFHTLVFSLTPLAVLAVAAAGVGLLRRLLGVRTQSFLAYAAAG
ncbi:MAG: glycosyltransferase family 87 protein [Candidatus Dormibacteria bacterium]